MQPLGTDIPFQQQIVLSKLLLSYLLSIFPRNWSTVNESGLFKELN
jgi:hypothetical protein